ncbi:copper-binding protein [Phycisphaeraceae bacterium D3-23]
MRWVCGAAVLLMMVLALPGCSDARGVSAGDYEHVYTVRARVMQLPDGSPGGAFMAYHEEISDYQAANGSVGMQSMLMPFTIVDDSVLDGVAVGDVVAITFGESFEPAVKQGVISIEKLPSDTVLAFDAVAEE